MRDFTGNKSDTNVTTIGWRASANAGALSAGSGATRRYSVRLMINGVHAVVGGVGRGPRVGDAGASEGEGQVQPAAVAFACSEARWPAPQVRHTWGLKQVGPRSHLLLFQLWHGGLSEAAVPAARADDAWGRAEAGTHESPAR